MDWLSKAGPVGRILSVPSLLLMKTTTENVHICDEGHGVKVVTSVAKQEKCPTCKADMECAGWFESVVPDGIIESA